MLYNAKNAVLSLDGYKMNYICFGTGKRNLLILPGLGDGLKTVKGMALPFAFLYRSLAKDFKVYVFSRKEPLEDTSGTREMAQDVKSAMDYLGIEKTSVLGVSMGGMIAQHLAALCPERIDKLILTVTIPKSNEMLNENILRWLELSKRRDIKQLLIDTAERTYTGKQLEQYRKFYPLLSLYPKPKDFRRFQIMAYACMKHDSTSLLGQIQAKTLVIGAAQDQTLGVDGSKELTSSIPNATCYIYENYGHGVYDESHDFQKRVLDFLK